MTQESEHDENIALILEAQERLAASSGKSLSFDEVLQECGITEDDLAHTEAPEIE